MAKQLVGQDINKHNTTVQKVTRRTIERWSVILHYNDYLILLVLNYRKDISTDKQTKLSIETAGLISKVLIGQDGDSWTITSNLETKTNVIK